MATTIPNENQDSLFQLSPETLLSCEVFICFSGQDVNTFVGEAPSADNGSVAPLTLPAPSQSSQLGPELIPQFVGHIPYAGLPREAPISTKWGVTFGDLPPG